MVVLHHQDSIRNFVTHTFSDQSPLHIPYFFVIAHESEVTEECECTPLFTERLTSLASKWLVSLFCCQI